MLVVSRSCQTHQNGVLFPEESADGRWKGGEVFIPLLLLRQPGCVFGERFGVCVSQSGGEYGVSGFNVCPYAGNIFTAKKVYIFTIKNTVFFFHVMRRIFILSFLILSADTDFVL